MRTHTAAAILLSLGAAFPAFADDDSGHWKIVGHVAGHDFTLDCRFKQAGQNLTGVCVDGPTGDKDIKGGEAHPLIKGQVNRDQISWTYVSHKSFFKFKVDYSGVTKGDHASGSVSAVGKTGTFTADHIEP